MVDGVWPEDEREEEVNCRLEEAKVEGLQIAPKWRRRCRAPEGKAEVGSSRLFCLRVRIAAKRA